MTPESSLDKEKKYYCQRCLNHDLFFPRKGHKSHCALSTCSCSQCEMVEQRRQLNNMLSKKKVVDVPIEIVNGRKIRDPKCARCFAHGIVVKLRGHRKDDCSFRNCTCESCQLVDSRRNLMAKQIKLRREQQRARLNGEMEGRISVDSLSSSITQSSQPSPPPIIQPIPTRPITISFPSPSDPFTQILSSHLLIGSPPVPLQDFNSFFPLPYHHLLVFNNLFNVQLLNH